MITDEDRQELLRSANAVLPSKLHQEVAKAIVRKLHGEMEIAFARVEHYARDACASKRTVKRVTQKLEEVGLIAKARRRGSEILWFPSRTTIGASEAKHRHRVLTERWRKQRTVASQEGPAPLRGASVPSAGAGGPSRGNVAPLSSVEAVSRGRGSSGDVRGAIVSDDAARLATELLAIAGIPMFDLGRNTRRELLVVQSWIERGWPPDVCLAVARKVRGRTADRLSSVRYFEREIAKVLGDAA